MGGSERHYVVRVPEQNGARRHTQNERESMIGGAGEGKTDLLEGLVGANQSFQYAYPSNIEQVYDLSWN